MPTEPQEASAGSSLAAVNAYFETYEGKDPEALAGLLTDDVGYVTPFSASGDLKPFLDFQGKEAVMGHIKEVMGNFSQIAFVNQTFTVSQDFSAVFLEAQGNLVSAKQAGQPYTNRYIFKFDIRHGLIRHIMEYANPVTFAKLNGIPLG